MILAILAAGMGSRYGGLKQIDPITDNGEFIIDFSVYDAVRAGFDKVVFIIKKEIYEEFRETIGKRVEKHVKVEYAFQELDDIPEYATVPEGRTKPWGTTHAIYAAHELLTEPFAVINADDFYGRDAFEKLAEHLKQERPDGEYCMVGYTLRNTLTDFGTVSRGRCDVDENGMLSSVTELTKISRDGNDAKYLDGNEWKHLSGDTIISMNCWGFTKDASGKFVSDIAEFFKTPASKELKTERYLPSTVQSIMDRKQCTVKVYGTSAVWFGVTYHEDKEPVIKSVRKLIADGVYPDRLWD